MFTATVAKDFAVFENVSEILLGKCSEYCTTKLKTSDDVFNFLKDTQDNFPEHDRDLLLEVMRGAAKCRNCLQVGSKCKDGEEISGSEAPGVLRAGLVVARREPGKSTICGFPCAAEFLFPMPGNLGQAEVVSFTKGSLDCLSPKRSQTSFVLKCIGHNKQLVKVDKIIFVE